MSITTSAYQTWDQSVFELDCPQCDTTLIARVDFAGDTSSKPIDIRCQGCTTEWSVVVHQDLRNSAVWTRKEATTP